MTPHRSYALAPAISPVQETSSAPASSSAHSSFPLWQDFPLSQNFPRKDRASSGSPRSIRPDSGTHPARLPRVSLATPDRPSARLPRKGGYPQTKGELSPLSRIFRRHQHLPLGCQPRSPECLTNVLSPLYVLAGLFRTLPEALPDSTPLISVFTTSPTPNSDRTSAPLLRIHGRYSFPIVLYTTMRQS